QIAASFILLAGASVLITTLVALQRTLTGFDTRRVLVVDVPAPSDGRTPQQVVDFYKESVRQIDALPGVTDTAVGMIAPWRDTGGGFGVGLQFSGDGHVHDKDDARALWRTISPGFFTSLGVPIIAGRDFNALDDQNAEPVVIVSATLARQMLSDHSACVLDRFRARIRYRHCHRKGATYVAARNYWGRRRHGRRTHRSGAHP